MSAAVVVPGAWVVTACVVVAGALVLVAAACVVVAGALVLVATDCVVVAGALVLVATACVVLAGALVLVATACVVLAGALVLVATDGVVVAGALVLVATACVVVVGALVLVEVVVGGGDPVPKIEKCLDLQRAKPIGAVPLGAVSISLSDHSSRSSSQYKQTSLSLAGSRNSTGAVNPDT